MKNEKRYQKELLRSLEKLSNTENALLETMTNLMLLKELKESKISFNKGDTFTFEDSIFDSSEDKNIRRLAKLRRRMLQTMVNMVEENSFKDKDIEFLS